MLPLYLGFPFTVVLVEEGTHSQAWPQPPPLATDLSATAQQCSRLKPFWWGFEFLQTHSVAVSQRTRDQRNEFTQLQREANLHSKNRQQMHHPNRIQTPHLFHPRQPPIHKPATSRCKISQNRWLNCQINQQRELWQYNKTTLNYNAKIKLSVVDIKILIQAGYLPFPSAPILPNI